VVKINLLNLPKNIRAENPRNIIQSVISLESVA
jgi:hypothetical protein